MSVKTLIADDEKPARDRLRSLIAGIPEVEIVGEAENGRIAAELIDRLRPDLVLLDIQMPALNGFEVLEQISHTPEIVFVTAYDKYAIRAFEVNAADYLLKPYNRVRLLKAIEKAVRSSRETTDQRARILSILTHYRESGSRLKRLTVRKGLEYRVFEMEQVSFFRAEDGLVFMYAEDERFLIDLALQKLEDSLDPERFLRIHRNAIVNMQRISRVFPGPNGKLVLEMPDRERLIVSRDRAQRFKSASGFRVSRRKPDVPL